MRLLRENDRMSERPSNRTEELRAHGLRRIVHITHDAREYVPAADYDALAAEVDRLRARALAAAPSEPSAEHWRRAISDWNGDHPRDPDAAYLKRIEQRARELSQESRRDG
jgi:hypothetical protein